MKYNYRREPVSQSLRQAVNEKICRLIEYDEALDKGITWTPSKRVCGLQCLQAGEAGN